ncbi:MAG: ATP-binding protein [Stellaceae bacterium]
MTLPRLHLWPRGIAGQLALIIVLALILAQAMMTVVFFSLRAPPEPFNPPPTIAARIGTAARLLDACAAAERPALLRALDLPGLAIRIAPGLEPAPEPAAPSELHHFVAQELRGSDLSLRGERAGREPHARDIAVELTDGTLLLFEAHLPGPRALIAPGPFTLSIAFLAASIGLLSVWATRRVTAPLSAFAAAAERLGQERVASPLAERGPAEIARAARAFNQMQQRLKRFVDEQTRMLAAISHDLRTPITRLRLRVESAVDDPAEQRKILHDLQRMEDMISSILTFLRENREDEAVAAVDLPSLLQTMCDELADLGDDVRYLGTESLPLRCRPRALDRALRNIAENAVKFGGAAVVTLDGGAAEAVIIRIEDDGPGIPETEMARVFEPFYRADPARDIDSGVGLGLSIARAIIRAHDGDIALRNKPQGGLEVAVRLPRRP